MKQTIENSKNIAGRDRPGISETATLNRAVRAAFRIHEYRELEHNLKTFGWRRARRRVARGRRPERRVGAAPRQRGAAFVPGAGGAFARRGDTSSELAGSMGGRAR